MPSNMENSTTKVFYQNAYHLSRDLYVATAITLLNQLTFDILNWDKCISQTAKKETYSFKMIPSPEK